MGRVTSTAGVIAILVAGFGVSGCTGEESAGGPSPAAPAETVTVTVTETPDPTPDESDDTGDTDDTEGSDGSVQVGQTDGSAPMLFITDQKDGDSFVADDGVEYRLGLVNTPERNEVCGDDAAYFTRMFLADGFTTDSYSSDTYGRTVAEIFNAKGRSLNVALARSGLANDKYLSQFRHENPDLAARLDRAFARAKTPECAQSKPAPLATQPSKSPSSKPSQASNCMAGYSPCLPIVDDLDCADIGHPVTVTGSDPYRLDADGDGSGCDSY